MEKNTIFSKIVEEYYPIIYNYCYSNLNFNHANAEDRTQEVFLTLLKKHIKLNLSDNIKLWLYRTADNVLKEVCNVVYTIEHEKIISKEVLEHEKADN